ncbi:hypothetical protein BKA69DRAFT_928269 [Paraphysoderma sedebokerense]|nr:hypothetical protein BKA69DRAFT_928269 [Paraphysoderma sedebokerense]
MAMSTYAFPLSTLTGRVVFGSTPNSSKMKSGNRCSYINSSGTIPVGCIPTFDAMMMVMKGLSWSDIVFRAIRSTTGLKNSHITLSFLLNKSKKKMGASDERSWFTSTEFSVFILLCLMGSSAFSIFCWNRTIRRELAKRNTPGHEAALTTNDIAAIM